MLIDKVHDLVKSKFDDIIHLINECILLKINHIPIKGREEKILIYIYLLFEVDWEQKIDVRAMKTKHGTTYLEVFQNENFIQKIKEYYESHHIGFYLYQEMPSAYKYVDVGVDSLFGPHYRFIELKLSYDSYSVSFLKEKMDDLIEEKFYDIYDQVSKKALESILEYPERGLSVKLGMREDIFTDPEDVEDYDSDGYFTGERYNYKESETSQGTTYLEIFNNPPILEKIIEYFELKGIGFSPEKTLDGSYNKLILDFTNMKSDKSELYEVVSNIEELKKQKDKNTQEQKNKEFLKYIEKIDAIILQEAIRFSADDPEPYEFRANSVFEIKNKYGPYYQRYNYEPEERTREVPDWGYTDNLGESQSVNSGSRNSEYVDLGYEEKLEKYQISNIQWESITKRYIKNGFTLNLTYSDKEYGYGLYYNYIKVLKINGFVPENSELTGGDNNFGKNDSDESNDNRSIIHGIGVFLILVVIMILLSVLI